MASNYSQTRALKTRLGPVVDSVLPHHGHPIEMSLGRASTDRLLGDVEINTDIENYTDVCDQDADGDKRKELERKLLWKLDMRLLFLVLVYIMDQVGSLCFCLGIRRLTYHSR